MFSLYKLTMSTAGPQFFSNSHNVNVNNPVFQNVQGDFHQYNGGKLPNNSMSQVLLLILLEDPDSFGTFLYVLYQCVSDLVQS